MPLPIRRLVLAPGAFVASSEPAWPSGNEGQQTVGDAAQQLLQQHPTSRGRVNLISRYTPLSQAATWADCAKGPIYCHRQQSVEEQISSDS
jgi:hypothetical protein